MVSGRTGSVVTLRWQTPDLVSYRGTCCVPPKEDGGTKGLQTSAAATVCDLNQCDCKWTWDWLLQFMQLAPVTSVLSSLQIWALFHVWFLTQTFFRLRFFFFFLRNYFRAATVLSRASCFNVLGHWGDEPCMGLVGSHGSLVKLQEPNFIVKCRSSLFYCRSKTDCTWLKILCISILLQMLAFLLEIQNGNCTCF